MSCLCLSFFLTFSVVTCCLASTPFQLNNGNALYKQTLIRPSYTAYLHIHYGLAGTFFCLFALDSFDFFSFTAGCALHKYSGRSCPFTIAFRHSRMFLAAFPSLFRNAGLFSVEHVELLHNFSPRMVLPFSMKLHILC